MKVVIYYEGSSEEKMFIHIFRRLCPSIHITEDILDFKTFPDSNHAVLFYDCGGAPNVFPNVADSPHIYENNEVIIIVRDLEKTPCFEQLKRNLIEVCPNLPPYPRTRLLFSKPEFEQVYFADLSLFKNVFSRMYEKHYARPISNQNQLQTQIDSLNRTNPGASIKGLFRNYGMAFKKVKLADEFFARFNYYESTVPYIRRVMAFWEDLISIRC